MATYSMPLAVQPMNRTSGTTKDAKLLNGYLEKTEDGKVIVIKRQGFGSGVLYEAGVAQGVVNYLGVNRVFVNNKFFKTAVTSVAISASSEIIDFA